jgi:uncharacterized protein (DUF1501 family)
MHSRRDFLRDLGRGTLLAGGLPLTLTALGRHAHAADFAGYGTSPLPAGTPILLHIVLDGGNDALNTLVPVSDPWYHDATYGHGPLALSPAQTLALNGSALRLHPALSYVAQRFNSRGDVAFIQGIGDGGGNSFSHFDAMKMWQTGDTALLTPTGWIGRYNDLRQPGNPYASMSMYDFRLESLGASTPAVVVHRTSNFYVREPSWPVTDAALWRQQLQAAGVGQNGLLAEVGDLTERTYGMSAAIVASAAELPLDETQHVPFTLAQAALLIRAGIPSQTYAFAYGPFDHHGDLLVNQQALLAALNTGLQTFFEVLGDSPRAADVVVMITSEFGRQVTANANAGTDHGVAGLALVFGDRVRGGFYGEPPTLDPGGPTRPNRIYDALPVTTNFRRLFGAVVNHLGDDGGLAQAVFGNGFGAELPIFTPAGAGDVLMHSGFESVSRVSALAHGVALG